MFFFLREEGNYELTVRAGFEQEADMIKGLYRGKEGESILLPSDTQEQPHVLLLGLGRQEVLTGEVLRNAYGRAVKRAVDMKAKRVQIEVPRCVTVTESEFLGAAVMGMNLGNYSFDKYKPESSYSRSGLEVYIRGIQDTESNRAVVAEALNLTDSIKQARDMIAEPTNRLYPEEFADRAGVIAAESGFEIRVMQEEEISQLGMEAFLTVGRGTMHKPRLIVMHYRNGGDKELLGLVGKGLTCDTGGYSLKKSESLMYMKSDMSGAATVLAVMSAAAKNKLRTNLCAVIACCENVLSGDGYKPGDVIGTMGGKTVEVLNTDAEGRLTLADALTYIIEKEAVKKVIDIATLTGAAGVTFGNLYTPFMTNNEQLRDEFLKAAKVAEEEFWQMPNHKGYRKMIESNIADLKNTAPAGTITAGMFLQEFVKEIPWIHLDIAATAVLDPSPFEYVPNGPSGIAVRTIYEWIQRY